MTVLKLSAVRVTTEDKDLIDTFLQKYVDTDAGHLYLSGYESQKKNGMPCPPHFHIYMEHTVSQQMLRKFLRERGVDGRMAISVKTLNDRFPLEYLAYCTKQGSYLWSTNTTEELKNEVEEYRLNYVKEAEIKQKAKKEKSTLRQTQFQQFESWIHSKHTAYLNEIPTINPENPSDMTKLVDYILEWYESIEKPFSDTQVQNIGRTFLCKHNQNYRYHYKLMLSERFCTAIG